MSLNRRSLDCFVTLAATGCLLVAAGRNEAQVVKANSSDHQDIVDFQRKAESALARVQRNDLGEGIVEATYYIELAAHVESRRAIPVLEAYFAHSHEADVRSEIASVLVSLGDEDPQYWNLIFNQAQAALSEDPPDPYSSVPCSSTAFLEWEKRRNLSHDEACVVVLFAIPEEIRPLADTGDPRVIPVLRQALTSRNPVIQVLAAHGLVLTGDRDAVTLVVTAIEHAPEEQAKHLADCLIESDDPRAESLVHQYRPDVNFSEAHQFRAKGAQSKRPLLAGK